MALAERGFVTRLDGGCSSLMAAYAQVHGQELRLTGLYYHAPSGEYSVETVVASVAEAEKTGIALAEKMLRQWT